jgi:hypothetical protein
VQRKSDPQSLVGALIICDYASMVVAVLRNMIKIAHLKVLKCNCKSALALCSCGTF